MGKQRRGSNGKKGRKPFYIPPEEIVKKFNLPIKIAAKELGVCVTVLKKSCRKYRIDRWPQRKVNSLNAKIQEKEALLRAGPFYDFGSIKKIEEDICSLQIRRDRICNAPIEFVRINNPLEREDSLDVCSGNPYPMQQRHREEVQDGNILPSNNYNNHYDINNKNYDTRPDMITNQQQQQQKQQQHIVSDQHHPNNNEIAYFSIVNLYTTSCSLNTPEVVSTQYHQYLQPEFQPQFAVHQIPQNYFNQGSIHQHVVQTLPLLEPHEASSFIPAHTKGSPNLSIPIPVRPHINSFSQLGYY